MAVTSVASGTGTQTAVINTTYVAMAANATAGTYVWIMDTQAMVAGDILEMRILQIINGGAETLCYYAVYSGVQSTPGKLSVPFPSLGGGDNLRFTFVQTAGTGRAFRWRTVTVG